MGESRRDNYGSGWVGPGEITMEVGGSVQVR